MRSDLRLSKHDAAKVKRLLRQPRPCLLCGGFPPAYTALLCPRSLSSRAVDRTKRGS